MTVERQELHCHNCNQYVQFDLDLSLTGNHVLNCPNCNHEHCRVIRDGKITADRWDQRNGMTFPVNSASSTSYSTYSISTSSSSYLYDSWMNTRTTT